MIIDLILDRHCDDEMGFRDQYDPHDFYMDVMRYGSIGHDISRAMDSGTENDVKSALCNYIVQNNYNPAICGYVFSVNWITTDVIKDDFGNPLPIPAI